MDFSAMEAIESRVAKMDFSYVDGHRPTCFSRNSLPTQNSFIVVLSCNEGDAGVHSHQCATLSKRLRERLREAIAKHAVRYGDFVSSTLHLQVHRLSQWDNTKDTAMFSFMYRMVAHGIFEKAFLTYLPHDHVPSINECASQPCVSQFVKVASVLHMTEACEEQIVEATVG
jgi:hypothetical protein